MHWKLGSTAFLVCDCAHGDGGDGAKTPLAPLPEGLATQPMWYVFTLHRIDRMVTAWTMHPTASHCGGGPGRHSIRKRGLSAATGRPCLREERAAAIGARRCPKTVVTGVGVPQSCSRVFGALLTASPMTLEPLANVVWNDRGRDGRMDRERRSPIVRR